MLRFIVRYSHRAVRSRSLPLQVKLKRAGPEWLRLHSLVPSLLHAGEASPHPNALMLTSTLELSPSLCLCLCACVAV